MPSEKKDVPGPEALVVGVGEDDDDAASEAAAFASGKLEEISKRMEHGRRETFRDHASLGAIIILWILMVSTGFAIFAMAWHFLTPWPWLSDEQLVAVKTYVFSGAVVAAIGGYLRRYLD